MRQEVFCFSIQFKDRVGSRGPRVKLTGGRVHFSFCSTEFITRVVEEWRESGDINCDPGDNCHQGSVTATNIFIA